jgi:hypothetical protein
VKLSIMCDMEWCGIIRGWREYVGRERGASGSSEAASGLLCLHYLCFIRQKHKEERQCALYWTEFGAPISAALRLNISLLTMNRKYWPD